MTGAVLCPFCKRAWRSAPKQRLALWHVKRLALRYVEVTFCVSELELRSPRRANVLIHARAMLVWIAKTYGPRDLSYPAIGRWIDKDQSSIQHQWKVVVPRLLERDADFAQLCGVFGEWAIQAQEKTSCN